MVKIELDYLMEKVENKLQEGSHNRNRREDLYELDEQISGLHKTFELIDSAQERELHRPVEEAMATLDSCMTIKG